MLIPTSRVIKPSPTTRVLSREALIVETSWVQLSSSSSEEHEYYSGEEVDFGDEPTLPDTSKFSHISEEEMQVYAAAMVPPSGEVATAKRWFRRQERLLPLRVFLQSSLLFLRQVGKMF